MSDTQDLEIKTKDIKAVGAPGAPARTLPLGKKHSSSKLRCLLGAAAMVAALGTEARAGLLGDVLGAIFGQARGHEATREAGNAAEGLANWARGLDRHAWDSARGRGESLRRSYIEMEPRLIINSVRIYKDESDSKRHFVTVPGTETTSVQMFTAQFLDDAGRLEPAPTDVHAGKLTTNGHGTFWNEETRTLYLPYNGAVASSRAFREQRAAGAPVKQVVADLEEDVGLARE
jgi:hypothetical protein